MMILIWFLVILGIFLALAAMEMGMTVAERYWNLKRLRQDNVSLIEENRQLRAENRRLACQANAKQYQLGSSLELELAEMQQANEKLQRELRVKNAMLKALDRKAVVAR